MKITSKDLSKLLLTAFSFIGIMILGVWAAQNPYIVMIVNYLSKTFGSLATLAFWGIVFIVIAMIFSNKKRRRQ